MIVRLEYINELDIPVVLRSNVASYQSLEPGQGVEITFDLDPVVNEDYALLTLVCEKKES